MEQQPIIIAESALRKLVLKAYRLPDKIPMDFPTVEDLDDFLESDGFKSDPSVRESVFKFLIRYVVACFSSDRRWHEEYPGFGYVTDTNLLKYVTTPLRGKAAIYPHCGIWTNDMSEKEKEDRQAAIEYMQSIILDESLYVIDHTK